MIFFVIASSSSSWKGEGEGGEKGIERDGLYAILTPASAHPNSAFLAPLEGRSYVDHVIKYKSRILSQGALSMGNKRKNETDAGEGSREKKPKSNTGAARNPKEKETPQATSRAPDASADQSGPSQKPDVQPNRNRRPHIRKLAPPRPFPTVASASSATGPRSAHHEGKNNICITRKTKLAAYLCRCKALLVDDGFKELRLSAMGAAIPHLALLAVSLPPILPWAEDEVHLDVFTGSVEVHDELLSESGSEVEDGPQEEFRTRVKSTMNVIIRVGQGEASTPADNPVRGPAPRPAKKVERRANGGKRGVRQEAGVPERIVLQEPEQDGMETS